MLIVVLRGRVKIMGFNDLLVSNNMINFFAVSFLSIMFSLVIVYLFKRMRA